MRTAIRSPFPRVRARWSGWNWSGGCTEYSIPGPRAANSHVRDLKYPQALYVEATCREIATSEAATGLQRRALRRLRELLAEKPSRGIDVRSPNPKAERSERTRGSVAREFNLGACIAVFPLYTFESG